MAEYQPEYVCNLPPDVVQRAESELNEKPETRDEKIFQLRKMITESPELQCPIDYLLLLRFLRAKKFDCNRAYKCLFRYYDVRAKHVNIFSNFIPSAVEAIIRLGIVTILPQLDSKGRRMVWIRPGLWDPNMFPVTEVFKAALMSIEWMVLDEITQVNGMVLLTDFTNTGFRLFKHLNRENIKLMVFVVQEAFPVRLKAIHIVNAPAVMQALSSILRVFLKQKMRDRFSVHGKNLKSLLEDLGSQNIPYDYGGTLDFHPQQWADFMLSNEVDSYFQNRQNDGCVNAVSSAK